jgi:nitroreductase
MDTFDAIARRTSTRTFKQGPLPRHVIERLLMAAVRAPNHKLTEPWRFAVITGDSKRRYAEIRAAHRAQKFEDRESPEAQRAIDKTRREHLDTPAFIMVMCAVSEDPVRREEDYGAAMMAIENMLVAAAADGIGTMLRTGGIMEHPDVKALVQVPDGYRIVGIISLGYLAGEPEPTPRRKPLGELVQWMD